MDHLSVKATECKCAEIDGRLKEQFISGINDQVMIAKRIRDLTTIKDTSEVIGEKVYHGQRG